MIIGLGIDVCRIERDHDFTDLLARRLFRAPSSEHMTTTGNVQEIA